MNHAASLRNSRPFDDLRNANATLIVGSFVGSQRRLAGGFVEAAVVRGEDDYSVFFLRATRNAFSTRPTLLSVLSTVAAYFGLP